VRRHQVALILGVAVSLCRVASADVCDPDVIEAVSCHTTGPAAGLITEPSPQPQLFVGAPTHWVQGYFLNEALPSAGDYTRPGIELSLGAGGLGTGAQEPVAVAMVNFEYLLADGVTWMMEGPYGNYSCAANSNLCYEAGSDYYLIWDAAISNIRRNYRAIKINSGTLPPSVEHIPVLIDYRMAIYNTGTTRGEEGPIDALNGQTTVNFGYYTASASGTGFTYRAESSAICINGWSNVVSCQDAIGEAYEPIDGREHSGTLATSIPLQAIDKMALWLNANIRPMSSPTCQDEQVDGQTVCVVAPFGGSGHAVADPYVYIDPAWEYASWFEIEMSADETDTTWVTPERTPLDLETLMPIEGGDPDAGTTGPDAGGDGDGDGDGDTGDGDGDGDPGDGDGDGDTGDGDGDGDGDGNNGDGDGDGDTGARDGGVVSDGGESPGGSDDGGCSCRIAGSQRLPPHLTLFMLGAFAALSLRKRGSGRRP
jgi:hypothetical protein